VTSKTIVSIIDGLGVANGEIANDDLVAAPVVIVKIVSPGGHVWLWLSWSDANAVDRTPRHARVAERIDLPSSPGACE
jgi:hypothetical protein